MNKLDRNLAQAMKDKSYKHPKTNTFFLVYELLCNGVVIKK